MADEWFHLRTFIREMRGRSPLGIDEALTRDMTCTTTSIGNPSGLWKSCTYGSSALTSTLETSTSLTTYLPSQWEPDSFFGPR